jgi:NAD(P)-dependent dehydrogenase (short-subunit alcohol dehydrogenase family)
VGARSRPPGEAGDDGDPLPPIGSRGADTAGVADRRGPAKFLADLEDPAETTRLVQSVEARFGRLDVLVNNASIFDTMKLDEFRLEVWDRALRVNLTAPLLLAYTARNALRAAHGRIVNLCDSATAQASPERSGCRFPGRPRTSRGPGPRLKPDVSVVGVARR